MKGIDLKSKLSIYEQIVDGIKADIVSGTLTVDSKLPSVRDLSAKLTVNPNTIQKAYKELEAQGWIYPVAGLGNFVSDVERQVDPKQIETLYEDIVDAVRQLRFLGVSEEDISNRLKGIIKGGNEK